MSYKLALFGGPGMTISAHICGGTSVERRNGHILIYKVTFFVDLE